MNTMKFLTNNYPLNLLIKSKSRTDGFTNGNHFCCKHTAGSGFIAESILINERIARTNSETLATQKLITSLLQHWIKLINYI